MASPDHHILGFSDVTWKVKLLRSLLREYVPHDKHPFTNRSDLSEVLKVQTHHLLSECVSDSTGPELIASWKSAVDAWFSRIDSLLRSKSPDKLCVGICLLGLSIQECSSERFLTSYNEWFNNILSHIQTSDAPFVRKASLVSVSGLFTRLGEFPTTKKDGITKLIQPVLKLLNEESSPPILEEAICLLCKLINISPYSVKNHYDTVEAAIFSRFLTENDNTDLLKKLGHCLVMLPKSRGDEHSWSLMMRKVLIFLNNQLTLAFQGLKEEETTKGEIVRLLLSPGKEPPPPLGGPTALEKHSDLPMKRSEQVLVSRVSTLMSCCTMMLSTYPVQVSVPVQPLIAVTKRVLMVDGSLSPSSPFMSILRHEFMCSELPMLHICSLDLLSSVVKGLRSHLLPDMAKIKNLLAEYFRNCSLASLPEIRIKVYSVLELLLQAMGMGISMDLMEVVINNCFIDLGSSFHEKSNTYYAYKTSEEAEQQPFLKKRKLATSTGSLEEESRRGGLEVERSKNLTPISVRIAALKVLEVLYYVAGASRLKIWRPKIDNLLIGVATNTCKWGWADDKSISVYGPIWQKLQLAALRALKASLLSCRDDPLHLPQSLEIFRKGTREIGTEICTECLSALSALHRHPRYPSLVDDRDNYDGGASLKYPTINNLKTNDPFFVGTQGKQPSQTHSADELYESWIGNGEAEVGIGKDTATNDEPYGTSGNMPVEKLLPGDRPSDVGVENLGPSLGTAADIIAADGAEMTDKSLTKEKQKGREEMCYNEGQKLLSTTDDHSTTNSHLTVSYDASSNYNTSVAEAPEKHDYAFHNNTDKTLMEGIEATVSNEDTEGNEDKSRTEILERISARLSVTKKGKDVVTEDEDDDLPDIVVADPDSD